MFWHSHWYHTHFKINELLWNIVTILSRIPSWGLNQFAGNVPYFKHLSPSLIILHHSSSCFTFLHHLSSSCIIVHHVSLTKMSLQPMTMFNMFHDFFSHLPWDLQARWPRDESMCCCWGSNFQWPQRTVGPSFWKPTTDGWRIPIWWFREIPNNHLGWC